MVVSDSLTALRSLAERHCEENRKKNNTQHLVSVVRSRKGTWQSYDIGFVLLRLHHATVTTPTNIYCINRDLCCQQVLRQCQARTCEETE